IAIRNHLCGGSLIAATVPDPSASRYAAPVSRGTGAQPMTLQLTPIGTVRSSRSDTIDDDWDSVAAEIVLDPDRVGPDAVAGLDGFSHIEVVFIFDQVDESAIQTGARHPRGNPEWPSVGILAQRAKMRPNRIGVTACRLLDVDGLTIKVAGLDAIDGTPVLDLKPVMNEFLPRGQISQPTWATELMSGYWSRT
ncbi:MAG TPA: SAM-dependent methyltransferase, partial [Mycobacteriales bacterium]|nr:SAM-dependent methyltransferase [Mycobacteriales bacterium]